MLLRTERLVLEPLSEPHAPALLAYNVRNREHLMPWEPARGDSFYTLPGQREVIARDIAAEQGGACAHFLAFERAQREVVACVNLHNIRRRVLQAAVIGYSVDAQCQGRGYATEAAGAVVRYAFDVLNLHRLETSYQPNNERSGRVLQKLGFVREGYAREYLLIDGAWRDAILVSLTNTSWQPAS